MEMGVRVRLILFDLVGVRVPIESIGSEDCTLMPCPVDRLLIGESPFRRRLSGDFVVSHRRALNGDFISLRKEERDLCQLDNFTSGSFLRILG